MNTRLMILPQGMATNLQGRYNTINIRLMIQYCIHLHCYIFDGTANAITISILRWGAVNQSTVYLSLFLTLQWYF